MVAAVGSRLFTLVARIAQIIVCLIVIGLTAGFIKFSTNSHAEVGKIAPFFFNIGMAAIALLFAIIWALPFSSNFQNWWVDLFIAIVWAAALVWLWIFRSNNCGGDGVPDGGLKELYEGAKDSDGKVLADNYCSKLLVNNAFVILGIALLVLTAFISYLAARKPRGGGGGGKGGKGGKKGGRRRH